MDPITRRDVLVRMIPAGAAMAVAPRFFGGPAMPQGTPPAVPQGTPPVAPPTAYSGKHAIAPLPFDPKALKGLSEKLVVSHHDNNYAGAVKRLNQIELEIAALPKDAPPYRMGSLKREELIARNSMVLHEQYFGNLGGDGKPGGRLVAMIEQAFGSLATWEQDFRLTGKSLGGGSGWVILGWDAHRGAVHHYWCFDHTHGAAGVIPLLVMDMYEHAYAIDYGANAASYLDAFFANLNWAELDRRAAPFSDRH
jgi:superoxide dismutase, Fe-Mn family